MRWVLVVPVKRLHAAKSRLFADGSLTFDRVRLSTAFALDAIAAGAAAENVAWVLVVTNDPSLTSRLLPERVAVVPDRPDAGLNAAIEYGENQAREQLPSAAVAALVGDLPALAVSELSSALVAASESGRAFVADADQVGTTMLTATSGERLRPSFGPASRHRHAGSGAVELCGDWPGLRCDVDTPEALARAVALGTGQATRAVLDAAPSR